MQVKLKLHLRDYKPFLHKQNSVILKPQILKLQSSKIKWEFKLKGNMQTNKVHHIFIWQFFFYLFILHDSMEYFVKLYIKWNLEHASISDQAFIFPKGFILYNIEGRFRWFTGNAQSWKLLTFFRKCLSLSSWKQK